jgi:hypothetical protein
VDYKLEAREGTLDYVAELWEVVSTSRGRDWFYDYLAAVYKYYYELRRHRIARKTTDEIQTKLSEGEAKFRNHPIRVLIDATCTADRRTKSRWTMALRYAWRRRTHWNGVTRYIKDHGGVAGSARLFTQVHPSRERTCRYRGPGARSVTPKQMARLRIARTLNFHSLPKRFRRSSL